MSQLFTSGVQSIGVSASASVFPANIQDWFPLGWTGWISLQFKELSRVFSNTVWWLSGKESASQWGRHRFNPWSRRIPYAMEQPSQCTTAIEPRLESLGYETTDAHQPWHSCSTTGEATTVRGQHTTAREEPQLSATRGKPSRAKNNKIIFKKEILYTNFYFAFLNLFSVKRKESSWRHFRNSALPIRIPSWVAVGTHERGSWNAAVCTRMFQSEHIVHPLSL